MVQFASPPTHLVYSIFFYAISEDIVIISNRFWNVLKALKKIGEKPALHMGSVSAALVPQGRLFEQSTSPNTLCSEIKMLRLSEVITISDRKAKIIENGNKAALLDNSRGSYEGQFLAGIAKISDAMLAAQQRSRAQLSLGLSGGVDSRPLLAFLVHLGLEKNQSVYITSNLLTKECQALVVDEVVSELGYLDAEGITWRSLRLLYLNWRNRCMFGRVQGLPTPLVNPLLNLSLMNASFRLNEAEVSSRKIIFEIFALLEPVLAFMEFDDPKKAFSGQVVQDSSFLGARLDRRPYQGVDAPLQPLNSALGPSESWVEKTRNQDRLKVEEIVMEQGLEALEKIRNSSVNDLLCPEYYDNAIGQASNNKNSTSGRYRVMAKAISVADTIDIIKGQ